MRKIPGMIMSIFVAFGVLLQGQVIGYTESANITTEQIQILSLINMQESEFAESALERTLTRSQFVQYAAYAMGLSDGNCTDKKFYTDIDGYNTVGYINTFAETGILTVGETREFEPDRAITNDEALKIIVSMLGYKTVAEYTGGFPQGYRAQANKLNLPVFFSSTTLTAAQCFSLLAEALEVPLYDMTEISISGKVKFSKEDSNTLLSLYHGIDAEEGYVRAVNTITLDDSMCDVGEMIVGDKTYTAKDLGYLEDYLGLYIKIFYKDDNNGGRRNAVLALPKFKTDAVSIKTQDIRELDSEYNLKAWNEKGQNYKQYKIARNVIVVKNGCREKSDIRKVISDLNYGTLKLIKSDTGLYDLIIIKDYVPVSVSSLSYEMDTVYDGLTNKSLNIEDYDYVLIMDEDGNKIDTGSLSRGDVLSVATGSEPNKYIEIIKALKSVSGKVESIEKKDDDTFCVINSARYKVCKEYLQKSAIDVGTNGTFKLDMFGNIVGVITNINSGKTLGLLVGVALDNAFNSSLKIKIFDTKGKMQIYSATDSVIIDGIKYKDMKKVADLFKNDSNTANMQVVQYEINSENAIKNIDTSKAEGKEDPDKSLRVVTPAKNGFVSTMKISSGGISRRLASNIYFNANTVFFGMPSEEKIASGDYTDDDFSIIEYAALKYGLELDNDTKGYYTSRDEAYAAALTVNRAYITTKTTFSAHLYVVTDIVEKLDDDDCSQKFYKFYNTNDRKEYEFYLDDGIDSKADIGDTVILSADSKGCINEMRVLYDVSEGGAPMAQNTGLTWTNNFYKEGSLNVLFAYAGYVAGNVVHGTFDKSGTAFDDNIAVDTNLFQPIIIDTSVKDKNEMVRLGDERDIRYMNTSNVETCSLILLSYIGLDVTGLIVYI